MTTKFDFWIPGRGQKGPMNLGLSVLSFFRPFVLPSVQKFSPDWLIIFSCMRGARCSCGVVRDKVGFSEKLFCPKNRENGPKIGFFKFTGKFTH